MRSLSPGNMGKAEVRAEKRGCRHSREQPNNAFHGEGIARYKQGCLVCSLPSWLQPREPDHVAGDRDSRGNMDLSCPLASGSACCWVWLCAPACWWGVSPLLGCLGCGGNEPLFPNDSLSLPLSFSWPNLSSLLQQQIELANSCPAGLLSTGRGSRA